MSAITASQATTEEMKMRLPELDYGLVGAACALLGLGLVMIASASMHKIAAAPLYFFLRHLMAIGIGAVASLILFQLPVRQLERMGPLLYIFGLFLLALVLLPGVGTEVNGATRWVYIGGFSVQTSEFMKLFMVIFIAGYLVRRQLEVTHSVWGFIKPMILLVLACTMIMAQPDFGTTTVLLVTALGMLFLGGVPVWQFMILIMLAGAALLSLVVVSPYRLQRVTAFLDPWADVNDSGYQLAQALIAFGRGEWTGVGLGNGIQKLFYLPEAHTDFLMAVIGEELGLAGTLVVVALFAIIVWRAFAIGAAAERLGSRFAAYMAQGFGLWIGIQAFINIGVNIGLLPTKGLTLPLMSYGGNSIIVACLVISILARIDYENRQQGSSQEKERVRWDQG